VENHNINLNREIGRTEESFDYKALVFKVLRYWYFIVLSVFIALLIAFLFNKYTKPIYETDTTILIESDRSSMNSQELMGFGFSNNTQNIQNEIGRLQSFSLVFEAVKNMDVAVSYFVEDNFITKELYRDNPFVIVFDSSHAQPLNIKFKANVINTNELKIEANGKDVVLYDYSQYDKFKVDDEDFIKDINIDTIINFNQEIVSEGFKFKLTKKKGFSEDALTGKNYFFVFNDFESITNGFKNFTTEPILEGSSIIKISLRNNNVAKAVDFLNNLSNVYLQRNLDQKNQVAENTIRFIDTELVSIADSLYIAEQSLQEFKSDEKLLDLNFQAEQTLTKLKEVEKEKMIIEEIRSFKADETSNNYQYK